MTRLVAALSIGFALGAALVWLLGNDFGAEERSSRPSFPVAVMQSDEGMELERVSAELELEREMRRRLAAELDQLREQVAYVLGDDNRETRDGSSNVDLQQRAASETSSEADAPWFSERLLADLGLDELEIERIREVWDRYEMAMIELHHREIREGKELNKKRLARDRRNIELVAQYELGDDGYDALLYVTDRENRVVLADVLESSPAAAAGLQSGDEMIHYDGLRVFRPRDLLRHTASGQKGEWVDVAVMRDGVVLRYHVQRGALGVRLSTGKRVPYLN